MRLTVFPKKKKKKGKSCMLMCVWSAWILVCLHLVHLFNRLKEWSIICRQSIGFLFHMLAAGTKRKKMTNYDSSVMSLICWEINRHLTPLKRCVKGSIYSYKLQLHPGQYNRLRSMLASCWKDTYIQSRKRYFSWIVNSNILIVSKIRGFFLVKVKYNIEYWIDFDSSSLELCLDNSCNYSILFNLSTSTVRAHIYGFAHEYCLEIEHNRILKILRLD